MILAQMVEVFCWVAAVIWLIECVRLLLVGK